MVKPICTLTHLPGPRPASHLKLPVSVFTVSKTGGWVALPISFPLGLQLPGKGVRGWALPCGAGSGLLGLWGNLYSRSGDESGQA